MSKVKKTIAAILIAVLVISAIGYFGLQAMMKSVGMGGGEVADYERRIEIWDKVPGNLAKSKLDDMNIKSRKANFMISTFKFLKAIVGDKYKDVEQEIDTFTYLFEIKQGFEKETYEDKPYIIPYLVDNSKGAVIVIPGGGFGYKSMDGSTSEGKDIALKLNESGYSAFVLNYRSNPYEYPFPQLDVQRAVRFLRFNAEKLGIDRNKIGMIGFSAGGNQVGTYINLIMGNDLLPEDYIKDQIDEADDSIIAPAMIYPALSYNYNVPMLFAMFNHEDVRDENKRQELLELTDLKRHINPDMKNQFVSYVTKDSMVGMNETKLYIQSAQSFNIDIKEVSVEGGEHGYSFEKYGPEYIQWLDRIMK